MKPLNYAMLKYFTKVEEACVEDVMTALNNDYGHFKAFKKGPLLEQILTAETNLLLEETRFELDNAGELKVYYRASEDGKSTINHYIKD